MTRPVSGSCAPSLTTTRPYGLPSSRRRLQHRAHVVEIDRHLGDEDVVGGDGDAAEAGDPAGVAAHRLDHHDAAMRLGRGPQPVHRLHHDVDGRVEAEGEVGGGEVVVDGLGHADGGQLLLVVQAGGDAERVVAADGDQGGQAEALEVLEARGRRWPAACRGWCATSRGWCRRGR